MKAVILAAGKGTRMGELTANLPKPMVEVEGKPVLEHIVEGLRKVESWTARFGVATVAWPAEPVDPFFNVNTGEDLVKAERLARLEDSV